MKKYEFRFSKRIQKSRITTRSKRWIFACHVTCFSSRVTGWVTQAPRQDGGFHPPKNPLLSAALNRLYSNLKWSKKLKYQIVIQWASSEKTYNDLIRLEEKIIAELKDGSDIDGHDFGSGQRNIFIHTNSPVESSEKIMKILGNDEMKNAKLAYININAS